MNQHHKTAAMGSHARVETAHAGDEAGILATLTLAFASDPANRWMYSSPDRFLTHFPAFVMALGGKAFESGTARIMAGARAVALWLPPGVDPDEEALLTLLRSAPPDAGQRTLLSIFEQMGRYHPEEPHWYLPFIGVDPAHQRLGYGSRLLSHQLRTCDDEGRLAFLEASSLESIPLYQRHGFEALGTIQEGASPPITPMLRRPRRASSSG